ncbi:MAG: hypothetical protein II057_05680, partial [Clostridia bacterium]|nr:hypothetical protein [Clostridia bacterium]
MTITTTNQKPVELNSLYLDTLSAPFDPTQAIKDNVVKPLFTPLIPSTPAVIDCDGHPVSEDDITQALFDCSGDRIDPDAEEFMQEVLAQTLTYYDRNLKTLTVQDLYAVQAAKKMGMIMPAPTVIYSTSDVIDTAKQFLSGLAKTEHFFASLAFYAKVQAFGYYFANESAWNEFKNWFNTQVTAIQPLLPQETVDLCNQMMNVRLNHLTESFVVRDDDTQNNDPYSFARLFVFYLMQYEQFRQTNNMPEVTAGHLPFSFAENFCPRIIIIVNVEKHAHAHHGEIKNEWDTIKGSMILRPKVLSNNKIASLTAVTRMANKMKGQAAASQQADSARSAIIRFRKTAPTSIDLYKYIMSIYKHTQFVQNSENAFKASKMTYQKASRREPDNPDRQGKTSRTIYRPDLHIYLDCSGSISERQYQDAIKT